MARRPFIAGNWKMYRGPGEADTLAGELKKALFDHGAVDVAVAPPHLAIPEVVSRLRHTGLLVAAQNLHWEKEGAFTGEVSAEMIRSCGCTHVIIGHSERRQYFGETDASVNRKIFAAFRAGLLSIVCVGETLAERDAGQALSVVQRQLNGAFEGLGSEQVETVTVAYEPVWAIGTGRNATPEQAQEMHLAIRQWLGKRFGARVADVVRIQYGGSVKPSNAALLLAEPDIDGALVGGASLDASSFASIVNAACAVTR
jgi:triosephosphate isomerase (TIM)